MDAPDAEGAPAAAFPRLAEYPTRDERPDLSRPADTPEKRAKDLRHDVKGLLGPIAFGIYELRKAAVTDERRLELAGELERAVEGVIEAIDQIRRLETQPDYTGPRPPTPDDDGPPPHDDGPPPGLPKVVTDELCRA